jgi:hypothetical protein
MRVRNRAVCLLVLFLLPSLGGCYTYATMPVDQVPVGADVRARISGAEADRLTQELGREQDRVITGELVDKRESDLLLTVPSLIHSSVASNDRVYQKLSIPRSSILEMDVRRLDKWKSGGLMALAAALVTVIAVRQFGGNGNPSGSGKGGTNK